MKWLRRLRAWIDRFDEEYAKEYQQQLSAIEASYESDPDNPCRVIELRLLYLAYGHTDDNLLGY